MRKYMIAVVAALTAIAFTAVAVAQTPEATSTFKVTPKKAGTKKKPKPVGVVLNVTNTNSKRTLSKLDITFPKTVKLSGKGFKACSENDLATNGPASCKKSKVGGGVAHALLGVNTAAPTPLTFKVTAFVAGKKAINFYLEGQELVGLNLVAPGKISGRKLTITVPAAAQSPDGGKTWAGLVSLETSLKGTAKKGKKRFPLITTTGCTAKKHKLHTVLTFIDNTVSPAGTVTTDAAAPCKK